MRLKSKWWYALFPVIFLLGCGTTERDWKQATANKTAAAYKDFVAKHPRSAHVDEADAAIESLDWSAAKSANTARAFNDFVAAHPQSPDASEAKARAETLDWNGLKGAKALDSYIDFYNHYPRSSRLEKLTGDIVGSPAAQFGPVQGTVFTVRGNVRVGQTAARWTARIWSMFWTRLPKI